jgi:hypothetical protein
MFLRAAFSWLGRASTLIPQTLSFLPAWLSGVTRVWLGGALSATVTVDARAVGSGGIGVRGEGPEFGKSLLPARPSQLDPAVISPCPCGSAPSSRPSSLPPLAISLI